MQELKGLLPGLGSPQRKEKELTKEEILSEAIDHIHSLHKLLAKHHISMDELDSSSSSDTASSSSASSPSSPSPERTKDGKRKPAKRARAFMILLFAVGLGLWLFPLMNPPSHHPLYYGARIPRHHSRILAGASKNMSNMSMCYELPVEDFNFCSAEDLSCSSEADLPPLKYPNFHCSLQTRRCTPHINVIMMQDIGGKVDTIDVVSDITGDGCGEALSVPGASTRPPS
eukprot:TRINITY_DN10687_c0_g1_i1.p1 TRINITY_DN10687_c0_g1~~TRINITY_DN10687_c0_g1_i1.p1  ORF type:complete len:229 (+),score=41.23 TRINITY_DN10687_c0_g1_i1:268-954(+)